MSSPSEQRKMDSKARRDHAAKPYSFQKAAAASKTHTEHKDMSVDSDEVCVHSLSVCVVSLLVYRCVCQESYDSARIARPSALVKPSSEKDRDVVHSAPPTSPESASVHFMRAYDKDAHSKSWIIDNHLEQAFADYFEQQDRCKHFMDKVKGVFKTRNESSKQLCKDIDTTINQLADMKLLLQAGKDVASLDLRKAVRWYLGSVWKLEKKHPVVKRELNEDEKEASDEDEEEDNTEELPESFAKMLQSASKKLKLAKRAADANTNTTDKPKPVAVSSVPAQAPASTRSDDDD